MLKRPVKLGDTLARVVEAQVAPQNLQIYYTELTLFIEVYVFQMRFNLNKIFTSDVWAEMSLN